LWTYLYQHVIHILRIISIFIIRTVKFSFSVLHDLEFYRTLLGSNFNVILIATANRRVFRESLQFGYTTKIVAKFRMGMVSYFGYATFVWKCNW
jgi:hypothetical protein